MLIEKIMIRLGLAPPRHPLFADNWHYFKKLDRNQPLAEYQFVVFDTELTGLDRRRDEIVSIGAVRIRDLKIIIGDTFYACIKPSRPLPKDSTLIHRITPQQVACAPSLESVLPDFLAYCDKAILVGHYLDLDMNFLNRACLDHCGSRIPNPRLDTMQLAKVYNETRLQQHQDSYQINVSYNLATLGKQFRLPEFNLHNAYEDALQTAYLLVFLIKKLHSEGIFTLRDLLKAG